MENFQYLIVGILLIYLIFEFIRNFNKYKKGKVVWISIASSFSLFVAIYFIVFKPQLVLDYWWVLLLLIIPNIYFQYLKYNLKDK